MIMSTTGIIISHPQPQNKSLIIAKWIHYYYLRAERLYMVDLGWVWIARLVFGVYVFPSFFFFFLHAFVSLRLLFMYCSMNSSCKLWLSIFFSQSVHIVHYLWTHKFHFSAIFSLKNGSHGTIYTFKNYFATVFFSFQFQFSFFSCIQTDPT